MTTRIGSVCAPLGLMRLALGVFAAVAFTLPSAGDAQDCSRVGKLLGLFIFTHTVIEDSSVSICCSMIRGKFDSPVHARTPTLTVAKRPGAAEWPVWATCIGWPLPQLGVPQTCQ